MKPKVYIETSVISYLMARPSKDLVIAGHQVATRDFWDCLGSKFDPYVSVLVIKEASQGNAFLADKRLFAIREFPVIRNSDAAENLARAIIKGRGIPDAYPEDALHIALAAMDGMDFVVTWNFSHINNPFTKSVIRRIVENAGYSCPELVSPDELLGEEE